MSLAPMLASPSTGSSNRVPIDINTLAGTHIFDVKLDGIRAFLVWDGVLVTLWNRNEVDITAKYPDVVEPARQHFATTMPGKVLVLDGEILADDGRFETALTRDKQSNAAAIARGAVAHPVTFHAFDLPTDAPLTWEQRRAVLDSLTLPPSIKTTVWSDDPAFLGQCASLGLEGVIAKQKTSRYQFGARSRSWIKFKNLHRVTCLVSGYEPGTGARAHFGAMTLVLVDPVGQLVPAGRVGTGMTVRQTHELKARLDAQEVLVVEIECLSVTSGGTLRMPVFKGIRTDVTVLAASTQQLATLPRS